MQISNLILFVELTQTLLRLRAPEQASTSLYTSYNVSPLIVSPVKNLENNFGII
jgi:hypothetical protein